MPYRAIHFHIQIMINYIRGLMKSIKPFKFIDKNAIFLKTKQFKVFNRSVILGPVPKRTW